MGEKIKDEPAFPLSAHPEHGYGAGESVKEGMSLRDYFAAHAPEEIPSWFSGPEPARPTTPVIDPPPHLSNLCMSWRGDPCYDLAEFADDEVAATMNVQLGDVKFLAEYQRQWTEHRRALAKASEKHTIDRYFAWRWYYAEQMLAAREGGAA